MILERLGFRTQESDCPFEGGEGGRKTRFNILSSFEGGEGGRKTRFNILS